MLGDLVAAVGAHDRAVRLLPTNPAVPQLPLVTAMVILTMDAIGLVSAPWHQD